MTRRTSISVRVVAVLLLAAGLSARQALTKQDSESMLRKLNAIETRGAQPPSKDAKPLRTSFTEREVNAYFKYDGQAHLPVGVASPEVVIADGGKLEGKAVVDLDAVRKAQSSAMLDLVAMFTNSVEVRAYGRLETKDGKGTFVLDRATVGGIGVPKSVLQSVVSHYSRTPDQPNGFDLDKPFDLPAAIRTVELQRGSAVIVQ